MDFENNDKPVEMDPTTLKEIARIMRETIGQEIPVGPAQTGAFNVTISWAEWLDQQAEQKRAEGQG